MLIRLGYELGLELSQPTTVMTALEIHPERRTDITWERGLAFAPQLPASSHVDAFGNRRRRVLAAPGKLTVRYDAVVKDSGELDDVDEAARHVPVHELPAETMRYLLGSRYCESDHLSALAWRLFGGIEGGHAKVQAICDYVHERISFGYSYARCSRTAAQAYEERVGVCRDFAHLAIAFCRALNIPARYVNGYLGDINVEPDPAPMDFSAWFEAFIGDRWYTFDPRHNTRRTGRVVVARGLDAADVPMIHTFGPHILTKFDVWTYEQRTPHAIVPDESSLVSMPLRLTA
jgi:transglutaminase-like putative cysteine protease